MPLFLNQNSFLMFSKPDFLFKETSSTSNLKLMFRLFMLCSIFILLAQFGYAFADTINIPITRQYFHDKIDNEQVLCEKLDGKADKFYRIGKNEEANNRVTDMLFRRVDDLQEWVELNDALSSNNEKIKCLNHIASTLTGYRASLKRKTINGSAFPALIDALENAINLPSNQPEGIAPLVKEMPYNIATIITQAFSDDPGFEQAQKYVYVKSCLLNPDQIIPTIKTYAKEDFADSLIFIAAKNNPSRLYTYAQSINTPEGQLIHNSSFNLVKTIANLSKTPNALMYFPFLDDIVSGKQSIDSIRKFVGEKEEEYDSVGYFKLLVKTEIAYHSRFSGPAKDTPIAMFGVNGLRDVLKYRAIRHFITPINDLHNENNLDIRMRALDSLSSVELYYMMVMGENDIFTSSYKHSFSRMMQRMGSKPQTDTLLMQVKFDYFKKFIKMAASFNRLDTFLRSMPIKNSQALMRAFVGNLDKSGTLEDATDVADSYSSITDQKLLKTILEYVKENEKKCTELKNEKGTIIYGLLKNIFLSADTANHINLSAIANIPSIYDIDNKALQDDSGRIVQQVFFYGDEDGKAYFPAFLNSFSAKDWRIIQNKEWVEIRSLKGKVFVFANKPLDYDANLDDSAQAHLIEHLATRNFNPSIVVHRGHSYWLPGTIERMPANAKIVLLGSCGGYKNLNKILDICPDAHIISTKEIGAGDINKPIINQINQSLIDDKKIVWKEMWSTLSKLFEADSNRSLAESWDNYVPPYKNLGAIFIKAYHKKLESL